MFFGYYSLFNSWVRKIYLIYLILNNYSRKSFNNIYTWLKDLKTYSSPDVKIFLVGNKTDLENQREVTIEEAKALYDDLEMDYFIESSAKTGLNAEKIFINAAKLLFKEYKILKNMNDAAIEKSKNKKIDINNNNKNNIKKKKCC